MDNQLFEIANHALETIQGLPNEAHYMRNGILLERISVYDLFTHSDHIEYRETLIL